MIEYINANNDLDKMGDDDTFLKSYGDSINRQYKDSLFKITFGEHPENALSLYNAVNNSHYTNIEDLSIKMLRDAMYIGVRNDVSFLFNHDLNLYETQSKFCGNMPMRGLEYFVELYKINLGSRGIKRNMLYSTATIPLPTPKYYVFYNGTDRDFERRDLHLSDAYEGEGDLEVTAHMINVNVGHNEDLLSSSKALADYAEVINRVRTNIAMHPENKEMAVREAVDSCIRDGVLADILREERDRVMLSFIGGLTVEEYKDVLRYEKDLEVAEEVAAKVAETVDKAVAEAVTENTAAVASETKFETVEKLEADGRYDAGGACDVLGVSLDDYNNWKAKRKR